MKVRLKTSLQHKNRLLFNFNIRYLQTENLEHCVPSSVSSGLASLPLSHVYTDGNKTAEATSKRLPTGEALNGTKAYESILLYFTTISKTPDQVHQLGKEMLRKLYPEVDDQCLITWRLLVYYAN